VRKSSSDRVDLNHTSGALRGRCCTRRNRNLRARIERRPSSAGLSQEPQDAADLQAIGAWPRRATVLIQGDGTGRSWWPGQFTSTAPPGKALRGDQLSAYPSPLLESELFGHEKGLSRGIAAPAGRFEQAHGGTRFPGEIGEICADRPDKLLRVLQSQKFERIGGEQTLSVDVRILAATNKNLLEQVQGGISGRTSSTG